MNPRTLADRWLRADLARFVAVAVLAMVGALAVGLFATSKGGGTAFGPTLGADYGEFYAVGMLLDRGQVGRLYDLDLQDDLLHEALPALPKDEHLPFVYPPFLAPPFRPLARLPFARSFAAWLLVSLGVYAASVALMLRGLEGLSGPERRTAWLLALSFEPFAMECWLGGQLSGLGCLAIASSLALRKANRPVLAGVALSALLYKPTLPLLLIPLLVVGRRWRMILGFAVGGVVLGLISLGIVGEAGCLEFGRLMAGYGRHGGSVGEGFKTIKYVDLRAFLGLLGLDRWVSTYLAILLGLPAMSGLVVAWARPDRGSDSDLAWSAALCWTPVLNLYGPIYDASIVVPALILAAGAFRARDREGWPTTFRWLLAAVYASALVSPSMARGLGFQPLTVALAAMGTYLIRESLGSGARGRGRYNELPTGGG
jgi:hypothetical protein